VLARLVDFKAPRVTSTFYATHIPPGETWRYSVDVADGFLAQLRSHAADASVVQFMVPGIHPPFDTTIAAGSAVLASATDGRAVLASERRVHEVIADIARARRIEVTLTTRPKGQSPVPGTAVFGWQRNGLAGRRLYNIESGAPWSGPMIPAFELRLLDRLERPILIGF